MAPPTKPSLLKAALLLAVTVSGICLSRAPAALPADPAPDPRATVGNGSQTLGAQARDAADNLGLAAPVVVTVLNLDPRATIGEWEPLMSWPIVAIHMTLLPNGDVLMWDSDDGALDLTKYRWNPTTNVFTSTVAGGGLFCSGHSILSDGRVLMVGGHREDDHERGMKDVNIFNPSTNIWTNFGRAWPLAALTCSWSQPVTRTGGGTSRQTDPWQEKNHT